MASPFSVSLVILFYTMFMNLNSNLFLSIITDEVCCGKPQVPTVLGNSSHPRVQFLHMSNENKDPGSAYLRELA